MTARVIVEAGACGVEATMDEWHAAGRYLHFAGGQAVQRMACLSPDEAHRLAAYIDQQSANRVRQAAE
ncbi:MAG TPA: hypothetical protein VLL76_04455 [Candidatus Omnitrophota bacterium]|nr:hypothetical protein [Candidatus Omnitrophota bacterium]